MNKARGVQWKGVLAVCAALGWWGAIYPQFTMVKGTYEVMYENAPAQADENVTESQSRGQDVYWEMLKADRGQIRFKSKVLTELKAWQANRQGKGE